MNPFLKIRFVKKVLTLCQADENAAIYSLLTSIDQEPSYLKGIYACCLGNIPAIIDSALEIFTGKRQEVAKTSYEYKQIMKEKENIINCFLKSKRDDKEKIIITISDDKRSAALALLCGIYLESFVRPIQFFLPHSAVCAGEWDLWEKTNYFSLVKEINDENWRENWIDKILLGDKDLTLMDPENFPLIVRRRLLKEGAFNKKFNAESMIKAVIIQLGGKTKPHVNYETIDFSIRSFFTYLGVSNYIRVDREIEFLRRFEKKILEAKIAD